MCPDNRNQLKPFGFRHSPYDIFGGRYDPLDTFTAIEIRPFLLVSESDDYVVCSAMKRETAEDNTDNDYERTVYVAKPWELRRSSYDGETINGVTYTYTDSSTRTASDGVEDDETQLITPDYVADTVILAVYMETNILDEYEHTINWVDLGIGRAWAVEI